MAEGPRSAPVQKIASEESPPEADGAVAELLRSGWSLLVKAEAAPAAEAEFVRAGKEPGAPPEWRMGVAVCQWLSNERAEAVSSCREYMDGLRSIGIGGLTGRSSLTPVARRACREVCGQTLRQNPSLLGRTDPGIMKELWAPAVRNWQGEFTAARVVARIEEILPKASSGKNLYAGVGLWACSLGLDDEAGLIFSEGLRQFPDSTTVRYVRGLWLWNDLGRLDDAIADFEAIHADSLRRSLNRPERLGLYPVSLWAAGRKEEAVRCLETLAEANPGLTDRNLPAESIKSGWGGWPPAVAIAFEDLLKALPAK